MYKPETQAVLGRDTEWADQSHKKHWDKTQNGQTRDTGSFETRQRIEKPDTGSIERRHIMDKPVTQAALRQDSE
jgi:hypothetical protein